MLASTITEAKTVGAAAAATPQKTASFYKFATIVRSQSTRSQVYSGSAASITDAKLNTQIVYSPTFDDLKTCQDARKVVSELLGGNITLPMANSIAAETYKSSECFESSGPGQ